jgi:DNA-binding NarL/FixJ family response regulator
VHRKPSGAETSEGIACLPTFLVVEDDAHAGRAFVDLLRDEWPVMWARSVGEAEAELRDRRFAGVVLDASLPDGSGTALLEAMRGRGDSSPVLMVTGHFDRALPDLCHRLDAACVFKPEVGRDVLHFAERAATVEARFRAHAGQVLGRYRRSKQLSPREAELLGLFVVGTPRRALGRRTGISENSVKTLVKRMLNKLDADDLDQAARWVLEDVAKLRLA